MTAPTEQAVLKRSIAATIVVGTTGVLFGLLSGSVSIVFDGVFSAVDASMTLLALGVTQLIPKQSKRFQMGFWHIEPMVLLFNAGLLTLLSFYAMVNAVGSILSGGNQLAFDWAIAYAAVVVVICLVMFFYIRRANRPIGSEFLALDVRAWAMSGVITAALLIAFLTAATLKGTAYAHWTPYVDPTILIVLTLCLIPLPIRTVFQALKEIFLVAPAELDERVRQAAANAVARHGFADYRTYVAKVGRSKMIEIYLIGTPETKVGTLAELDRIRAEIGVEIGDPGHDRWLTIAFTGEVQWAE
ncbi:cation transporter [Ensifer sesbaniae]|uniref:cation diffusion facilitator family transporter n=1 Tax=Ensifer sesbaniae TaxID=1214071 RepID=UPI0015689FB8|nr:cation transporter [Ensifer sesbaniae]MCK3780689.1 cation transporter [Ensifer sesbaniae]NRQ13296.1 Zinc transporter ZitB [Ensifer sesbaniae]